MMNTPRLVKQATKTTPPPLPTQKLSPRDVDAWLRRDRTSDPEIDRVGLWLREGLRGGN